MSKSKHKQTLFLTTNSPSARSSLITLHSSISGYWVSSLYISWVLLCLSVNKTALWKTQQELYTQSVKWRSNENQGQMFKFCWRSLGPRDKHLKNYSKNFQ